jgi:fatty-acyl-CoA synthase
MSDNYFTLGSLLDRIADKYPKNLAVVSGEKRISYCELQAEVNKLGRALLSLGVQKGERVSLLMDNRPEFIIVDFAVAKIGAVLVPINIRYRLRELSYQLGHCKPSVLIMIDRYSKTDYVDMLYKLWPDLKDQKEDVLKLNEAPFIKHIFCLAERKFPGIKRYADLFDRARTGQSSPDKLELSQKQMRCNDLAQIIYTSGSTAAPKGVMLSHLSICKNAENYSTRIGITKEDKFWVPIPLFFTMGCDNAVMTAISKGACLVLQRRFEPVKALKLIEKERCTVMYANSTIYLSIADHPYLKQADVFSLKKGVAMGSPQSVKRLVEEMGMTKITTGYGLTETSAMCLTTSPKDSLEVRINTNGIPLPDVTVVVKDPSIGSLVPEETEGEIRIKGYNIMQGYYDDPEKTSAAFDDEGFFCTGDIGLIRKDGNIVFKGRYKEMLKTSGINVSPLEVEMFLETHPDIIEAHVVGIPDELKDEVGVAFIRVSPGKTCKEEDIKDYCDGRIASYKIPKYFRFVSEFPLTGTNKVKKSELRDRILREISRKS